MKCFENWHDCASNGSQSSGQVSFSCEIGAQIWLRKTENVHLRKCPRKKWPIIDLHCTSFRSYLTALRWTRNLNNRYRLFVVVGVRGTLWLHFGHLPTVMRNFLIWVKAGHGTHTLRFCQFRPTSAANFSLKLSNCHKTNYIMGTLLFLGYLMNFARLPNSK